LADVGRDAVRDHSHAEGSTPKSARSAGQEAALKVCGVGAARLPGRSWAPILADRHTGNVGTTRGRPGPASRAEARAGSSPSGGLGWGGGPVVARARERRVHGEGGQQVSSRGTGRPGGRG